MQLHPRTIPVQRAAAQIGLALLKLQNEYQLTEAEMMRILADEISRSLSYCIRAEREIDTEL